jgi:hypothetical protein
MGQPVSDFQIESRNVFQNNQIDRGARLLEQQRLNREIDMRIQLNK